MAKVLKSAIMEGISMIQQRYAMSAEKVKVALKSLKATPTNDPTEAQWVKGEIAFIPKDLDKTLILNTNLPASRRFPNGVPGFAVSTPDGRAKVLYLSTLMKSAFKYEQTEDGYELVRDANGMAVQIHAPEDNEIRKICMTSPNFGVIADKMAGHWIKVADVLGPITTATFRALTPEERARGERAVVNGLRQTTVPVFEFLSQKEVDKLGVYSDNEATD